MNRLLERFRADFQDEEARYVYAETFLNALVAAQIKILRECRNLSQEQLAEIIGTKQPGVSRLESVAYDAWNVKTLRKLARAFGVRLRISFEEFGSLADEVASFNRESLQRREFAKDPAFHNPDEKPVPGA